MRIIQIEDEKDWEWLAEVLNNLVIKAKNNPSVYCGHIDQYQRISNAIASAARKSGNEEAPAPKVRRKRQSKTTLPIPAGGCHEHPKYQGVRATRNGCEGCWAYYEMLHGKDDTRQARARMERKARRNGEDE